MSNYEEQYRGTYNLVKEEQDLREGISLRDHFAGLAMQEFMALNNFKASLIVTMSYEMADLMLVERKK